MKKKQRYEKRGGVPQAPPFYAGIIQSIPEIIPLESLPSQQVRHEQVGSEW